jgi:apolipoprotein N-acyltransferase
MLGVGFIYALIFYIIGILGKTIHIRAILIFSLTFIEPFGFNWLKPELILINSYFSTNLTLFALFLAVFTLHGKAYWKLLAFCVLILFSFLNTPQNSASLPLHVAIANVNLDQDKKWDKKYEKEVVEGNFNIIEKAIEEKKDLVILPESAFPLYLNLEEKMLFRLKKLSKKIAIFTGGLRVKDNRVFNSSYLFVNGTQEVANKVLLVPFGEEIPLPQFATDFINKMFFNGAEDYKSAKDVHDFQIDGYQFRNAICFEATKDKLFADNPKQMIAISNNAWFTPSIEPTLQNLLLKLYAKRHNTTIYHSANFGISGIIHP